MVGYPIHAGRLSGPASTVIAVVANPVAESGPVVERPGIQGVEVFTDCALARDDGVQGDPNRRTCRRFLIAISVHTKIRGVAYGQNTYQLVFCSRSRQAPVVHAHRREVVRPPDHRRVLRSPASPIRRNRFPVHTRKSKTIFFVLEGLNALAHVVLLQLRLLPAARPLRLRQSR